MKTVACPKCSFANADADVNSKCAGCGEPLASALLRENLDELKKLTERMQELTAPSFTSFNGCGTTLLDYREMADATWEATRWVIVFGLPVVPLATYVIEPTRQESGYGRMTSHFKILAKGRLALSRVLRVYALVFVGLFPIVWGSLNNTLVNRTLGGVPAFFAMLACIAWGGYIIFWKLKNDSKAYKAKAAAAKTTS
ncbi:MAG TPA: hypothetical protein VM864_12385 [Pyrinomonadaceae bacterium]|jgi:hypothetical protein|nr:hypothetical protein [Pyrinomonadaceae bacterium]